MYLVAFLSMVVLIITTTTRRVILKQSHNNLISSFKRLPYALIPFFLSMFIIVVAFINNDVSTHFANFLNNFNSPIYSYGVSYFLVSNVMNNIPMSIFYTSLTSSLEGVDNLKAVYASIIGSNLGALFTPLGALAGIMFSGLVRKKGVKFSFLDFFKYGSIISISTLCAALLVLDIIL